MDAQPVRPVPATAGKYAAIDDLGYSTPAAFKVPPLQTGHYRHFSEFGEATEMQFRRMPRARSFTGQYGVFVKDADAGPVLVAVLEVDGETWQEVTEVYRKYFKLWAEILQGKAKYVLFKPACAWCGRETIIGEFLHAKCIDRVK